jgi:hypothetical protein
MAGIGAAPVTELAASGCSSGCACEQPEFTGLRGVQGDLEAAERRVAAEIDPVPRPGGGDLRVRVVGTWCCRTPDRPRLDILVGSEAAHSTGLSRRRGYSSG